MKKVLSFVLVLSLVLGSFSMAFAATPTDVVGKDCETAVQALSDLGVVSGYTDGTYKPENPVNRAEACKLIISALGLDAYAAGITATSFTDLDGYGWAVGYIGYAERLGLVKGVGNGKFNPGGPVTYEQWATMLVRALGYTDEVLPGAWPANYMIKAQSLGIMKNIKAAGNAAANRGDVAIMLYNDLDQAIGTIDKDGVFQPNRGKWDDAAQAYLADTMLSRLEKASTADFEVFTDADLANVADGINLRAYLGANVKMYLNDDKEFIGIKDCKTTTLTGDLNKAHDTFTVGDTEYTIKNEAVTYHFINGKLQGTKAKPDAVALPAGSADDITLTVEISGKSITKICSLIDWVNPYAAKFDDGDLNVSKAKLLNQDFSKNNNDEIDTTSFELVGVSSLDKIAADNIVEVYLDGVNRGKIVRVAVGTQTVEGTITKVNADGNKFTIDSKTYKDNEVVRTAVASGDWTTAGNADAPEATDSGKFFLTYFGKIAAWEETDATADNYAVWLGLESDTNYKNETTYIGHFFTKEGKEIEKDLKDDIEVKVYDAATKTTAAQVATVAALSTTTDAVIKFALNSKDKVSEIVFCDNATLSGGANKAGTRIGGKSTKSTLVVFVHDGKDWTVGSIKDIDTDSNLSFTGNKVMNAARYAFFDDGKVAALAITDKAGDSDNTYGVIDSTSRKANSAGEKVWAVDGFADGKELSALVEEGDPQPATANLFNGLQKIDTNGKGEVTDVNNAVFGEKEIQKAIIGGQELTTGAISGYGTLVKSVNRTNLEIELNLGVVGCEKTVAVYKWDNDEEEWQLGSFSDISKNDYVKLYQTDDDYDDYDVVLVWDADTEAILEGHLPALTVSVNAEGSATTVVSNTAITFSVSGAPAGATYAWTVEDVAGTFDDNTSATPALTFTATGTAVVRVTVTKTGVDTGLGTTATVTGTAEYTIEVTNE